jgi:hypothetical protein
MPIQEYCGKAERGQNGYFNNSQFKETFYMLRAYGTSYNPISNAHNVV